jgi:hypothetical protein
MFAYPRNMPLMNLIMSHGILRALLVPFQEEVRSKSTDSNFFPQQHRESFLPTRGRRILDRHQAKGLLI